MLFVFTLTFLFFNLAQLVLNQAGDVRRQRRQSTVETEAVRLFSASDGAGQKRTQRTRSLARVFFASLFSQFRLNARPTRALPRLSRSSRSISFAAKPLQSTSNSTRLPSVLQ